MNLDANIQKILALLLRKWKVITLLAVIGALLAAFYTTYFTTLTYSSSVEFLSYAQESNKDLSDSTVSAQTASNTSKMNYAMKMLNTYVELFQTNDFNKSVADNLNEQYNTSYSASQIKRSVSYSIVEDTAMFKIVVTTTNADMSYQIASQLEKSIPQKMKTTNNGLILASVEDPPTKASTSESRGYLKKCIIGAAAGVILAIAYIILRDLLDVRIKGSDELTERYGIPVLGTIPEFEIKQTKIKAADKSERGGQNNG